MFKKLNDKLDNILKNIQPPTKTDLLELFKSVGKIGPITHTFSDASGTWQTKQYIDFSTIFVSYPSGC